METQDANDLRKVIREVVTEIIAPLPTRDEIKTLATRAEIKTLATRAEMDAAFDHQAEMIQKEFQRINSRLTALEGRVAKLEDSLGLLAERVNKRLEKTSDDIADQSSTIKRHRVDQLTAQERLEALEERVAHLEATQHG